MEILKFAVFISFLGKALAVCTDHNGNEPACMADVQRCHWCHCIETCIPEEFGFGCDAGCLGLCGEPYFCAASGCIFDYTSKKCYDFVVDKGVDFAAVCSSKQKDACISQGCYFCPCSKKCVPPNKALECDKGCYQYCGKVEDCATSGCIYDYNTNMCAPSNGKYRYSAVICHDSPVNVNGIYYLKTDYTKIQVLQHDIGSNCYCNDRAIGPTVPDRDLYKCVYETPDANIYIPVKQGGKYVIGIHIAEIYYNTGRVETFQLNGITIVDKFSVDSLGPLGTPHTFRKEFEINCDLNEITVDGQKAQLNNNQLVLHMYINRRPGEGIHAIISGYYLEKID